jgi:uncharacterized protein (TIGR03435 family)
MIARYLVPVLATLVAAGAFAQTGFFGPVTSTPKAGDLAPEISFDKVLSAPEGKSWIPSNLFGQMTVVTFYPNISVNLRSMMMWNALIDQFTGKSVQFVCITKEQESSLLPWLAEHPLKSFVLFDPGGATGRSYGLETPATVLVGTDGRIIGFDRSVIPTSDLLNAALEGRITTTPLKPGAAEFQAFIDSHKVLLDAQGPRVGRPEEHKPDFPPSYTVHISPSESEGTGNYSGMDFWSLEGFDLKGAIGELYKVNPIRIELPASLDDGKRYDFSLVLPENESQEQISGRFQKGIQDYFYLTAKRENRLMDVYVVTAPTDRKPPAVKEQPGFGENNSSFMGSIEFESPAGTGDPFTRAGKPRKFSIGEVSSLSVEGTMRRFCRTLERSLDRPVIDETNLQGQFAFRVERNSTAKNDFLVRLRDGWGLVIEPARRNVEVLVFNPR